MNPLLTALYTKVTELTGGLHNAFYLAINGQYYLGEAPDDITGAWCVLYPITDTRDLWFGAESFQDYEVQFSLFDQTRESAANITTTYGLLTTLLDEVTLTVTGKTFHRMVRLAPTTGPDWFPDDGCWQMTVSYEIKLEN